ncbi:MAG: hypothetical protein CMC73_04050 [Flavobacteriaceae bacterium]|jgi:hypothetical protein|nr:hypothetical protein [Flavobacteriaceae bacterium]|tara:strand:+ start:3728 stop:4078 length:351 start_codon:yes stop_codon:yes gene_type:complete
MSLKSVKLVRLISGEELLGEVTVLDSGNVKLKNSCQVATSYADPTSATARIGLAPFLPYTNAKDGVEVQQNYIGFITEPVTELLNEYSKVFGSGLVLPDNALKAATSTSNHGFVKA